MRRLSFSYLFRSDTRTAHTHGNHQQALGNKGNNSQVCSRTPRCSAATVRRISQAPSDSTKPDMREFVSGAQESRKFRPRGICSERMLQIVSEGAALGVVIGPSTASLLGPRELHRPGAGQWAQAASGSHFWLS